MMAGPPVDAVQVFVGWLVVFVLAIGVGGWSLRQSRRHGQATHATCAWLLLLTTMLPIAGLITILFDDFVRLQWFYPDAIPAWFFACEIYFWVVLWLVLAGVILFIRRPVRPDDWYCTAILGIAMIAGATLLNRGFQ